MVLAGVACSMLGGCHMGLLGLVSGGAAARGPYLPETIAREIGPASMRTIGCLDVGLVPFQRDGRELVDLHVGNRCGHPEALDMRRVVIRGYSESGASLDVTLSDPRGEIDLLHVGGSEQARERIGLENGAAARRLCFHVDRIAPDAPSARPAPLCFDRTTGDAWRPG
jgi:hypothetical protein